ncbi:MAG: hypothetical protein HC909_01895, partial [Blastochloris sp.]|nr:hypothetical protein [Blastochloris sp.]
MPGAKDVGGAVSRPFAERPFAQAGPTSYNAQVMAIVSLSRLKSHPLAGRPVPQAGRGAMVRARQVPFDAADARGREPLVDARAHGLQGESYYA